MLRIFDAALTKNCNLMYSFRDISKHRKATIEQSWEVFDSLDPVTLDDLVGFRWSGYEVKTGHPLSGVLEENRWFGKDIIDEDNGQPLLVYASDKNDGNDTFAADAVKYLGNLEKGKDISITKDELEASGSVCRFKTILYRGVNTVSLFYDHLPINDTFKKVDENTLFGVMDNKAIPGEPYFFVLEKFKKLN